MDKKELQLPDFIQIPRPIMEDQKLTQLDWSVYGLIYWYSRLKLQKCILSNASFGQLTNSNSRSIQRSLARLEDQGHIVCEYNQQGTERVIFPLVTYFKYINKELDDNTTTVQSSPHDSSVMDSRPIGHPNNIELIRELNNKEKNIIKKEKSESYPLKAITEDDLQEIASDYNVPLSLVTYCLDSMKNWCEAKGKRYSNYKSALRNWVKKEARNTVERRLQGNVRPTVDARGLSKRV